MLGARLYGLAPFSLGKPAGFPLKERKAIWDVVRSKPPALRAFCGFVAYLAVDRADDAGLAKTAFRACALSRLLLADRLSALASLGLLPCAQRRVGLRGGASSRGFPDRPFLRAMPFRVRKAGKPER